MRKVLFFLYVLSFFVACKDDDEPTVSNETIDELILGTWQVDYSQTIKGVRMRPDGSLQIIEDKADTATFLGVPNTPVSSYMFGKDENIVDLRNDNKIKIYFINSGGGVTVSKEQAFYYVRNDTLFKKNSEFDVPHKYQTRNDSLIIERIPSEEVSWTYIISKYFKASF